MLKTFAIAAAMFAAAAPAAQAADRPVVLEMFVSQGCGACGRANDAMMTLAARDEVFALTYSVDYWDYLGWRDTFAERAFTKRQKAYMRKFDLRSVYTPQIVIDGLFEKAGSKKDQVAESVEACLEDDSPRPTLDASVERGVLTATVAGDAGAEASGELWLVRYVPGLVAVDVEGGENAGQTFRLFNPVEDIARVGAWDGGEARFESEIEPGAYAVLLQSPDAGPILAMATVEAAPPPEARLQPAAD